MENNIPTAEEFISNVGTIKSPISGHESYLIDDVTNKMIEFAKLHVELALKAAIDNISEGSSEAIEECIKNSYSLDNIK